MTGTAAYAVAIVVDPNFVGRLTELLERLPVWIADTPGNREAVAEARALRRNPAPNADHTVVGAWTTFRIDPNATPESWCLDILDTVAGHHDQYSHSPGYSSLEVYGAEPSHALLGALAEYRLTEIVALAGGFRASTRDGQPAGSPNEP